MGFLARKPVLMVCLEETNIPLGGKVEKETSRRTTSESATHAIRHHASMMLAVQAQEKQYPMWTGFQRVVVPGKKHPSAVCNFCRITIQSAQPSRHLLHHASACPRFPKETLQELGQAIFNGAATDSASIPHGRVSPDASSAKKCSCACVCGACPDRAVDAEDDDEGEPSADPSASATATPAMRS
jgi:hypothetical protein